MEGSEISNWAYWKYLPENKTFQAFKNFFFNFGFDVCPPHSIAEETATLMVENGLVLPNVITQRLLDRLE